MASKKTILLIEVNSKEYNVKYSGGLSDNFADLSEKERKERLRHDGRIMNALLSMPEYSYNRLASLFRTVDRIKRREARRATQSKE